MVLNTGAPSGTPAVSFYLFSEAYAMIRSRISLANVMITPPASVRNPFALWLGSWLFKDSPTCTTPNPSRIKPMARISNGQRISGCKHRGCPYGCNKNQCHIKPHPFLLLSPHRHRGCHFFRCILFRSIFFSCEKFLQYTSLQSIRKTAIHQGCPR